MSYQFIIQALKGGAGSGNFGHSGRPGKLGGSMVGVSVKGLSNVIDSISDCSDLARECQNAALREYDARVANGENPKYMVGKVAYITKEDALYGRKLGAYTHAWVEVDGKVVDSTPLAPHSNDVTDPRRLSAKQKYEDALYIGVEIPGDKLEKSFLVPPLTLIPPENKGKFSKLFDDVGIEKMKQWNNDYGMGYNEAYLGWS